MTGSFAPEPSLSVEAMTEADLDQILYLERSSFLMPWSRNSFLNAVGDTHGMNLVCRRGDALVGYVTAFIILDEVYITNLLVAARDRRRGYGTQLLRVFMNRVKERQGRHIFLEVREKNAQAIGFYEALNFQSVGVRKKYYSDTKEDALVMKLSLP